MGELPDCKYLVDKGVCSAIVDEEAQLARSEECTKPIKNYCCYICDSRKTCSISCDYLGKNPVMKLVDSIKCSNCGAINRINSKFCKGCGASMQALEKCPQCGNKLDPDASFCQECGFQARKQKMVTKSDALPLSSGTKRLPFGLEILIVLGAFGALFYFVSAIGAFWAISTILGNASDVSEFVTFSAIFYLVLAVLLTSLSWGLWKLKKWAWGAAILVFLIGFVLAFFNPIYGVTNIVYNIIVLFYLNTANVKALFFSTQETKQINPNLSVKDSSLPSFEGSCPSCGRKGKIGERFCKNCGAKMVNRMK